MDHLITAYISDSLQTSKKVKPGDRWKIDKELANVGFITGTSTLEGFTSLRGFDDCAVITSDAVVHVDIRPILGEKNSHRVQPVGFKMQSLLFWDHTEEGIFQYSEVKASSIVSGHDPVIGEPLSFDLVIATGIFPSAESAFPVVAKSSRFWKETRSSARRKGPIALVLSRVEKETDGWIRNNKTLISVLGGDASNQNKNNGTLASKIAARKKKIMVD